MLNAKPLFVVLMIMLLLGILPTPAPAETQRKGLTVGFAVGGGIMRQSNCQADTCQTQKFARVSIPNLKIGVMVSPRFALQLSLPTGVYKTDEGNTRAFDGVMASAQYWPVERLWVSGGLGIAEDLPPLFTKRGGVHLGAGFMASAGYEVFEHRAFAIDVQARLLGGRLGVDATASRDNLALDFMVGLNWY